MSYVFTVSELIELLGNDMGELIGETAVFHCSDYSDISERKIYAINHHTDDCIGSSLVRLIQGSSHEEPADTYYGYEKVDLTNSSSKIKSLIDAKRGTNEEEEAEEKGEQTEAQGWLINVERHYIVNANELSEAASDKLIAVCQLQSNTVNHVDWEIINKGSMKGEYEALKAEAERLGIVLDEVELRVSW